MTVGTAYGAAPPRNWWGRNWKWVVPVGCLSLLVIAALFVAFILTVVVGAMRSTDAYKDAMAAARANPQVIEAIGTPMKPGLFISGNVNVQNDEGTVDMAVPISGPKGKGEVKVIGQKAHGVWRYSTLEFRDGRGGEAIDLQK